jgi:NTP pyrophosphatase (non-canonical NTP hydrolase)
MNRHPLKFADLRLANLARCYEVFHALEDWSPTDWGTAVAGEVGEALNLVKKLRRGEPVERNAIGGELADAVIYIDLLAARLGIDLGRAVAYKFNRVSERRGAMQMLLLPDPGSACPLGNLPPDRMEYDERWPFPQNATSPVAPGTAGPDSA